MTFADRLKSTIGKESVLSFANRAGIKDTSVRQYLKGVMPGLENVLALAAAGKVSVGWLANGETDHNQPSENTRENHLEHLIAIPLMNVTASAGGGRVALDETKIGFVGFEASWLHSNGLTPADLFTLPSDGESMEPTINSGEFLLCSKSDYHIKPGDGIYVIRLEGDVLVKRLQRIPGEKIKVISDNAAYAPYEIPLNDGIDFMILGKVMLIHGVRRV